MLIEFEDLVIDEENDRIILSLQTENHDYGFQKVIRLDEDTDTPQGLRTFLEGMAGAIAKENNYDEAVFDFDGCGYFTVPEEEESEAEPEAGEGYTEEELMDKLKDELIEIAEELELDTGGTKTDLANRILEAQE